MRKLIPIIGVLFLTVSGAGETNIGAELPASVNAEEKARVIGWMARNSSMPLERLEEIYTEINKYGFPELLIAIAKVESSFDPRAVSHEGAAGLMQVMARIWKDELKKAGIIANEDDLFEVSKCVAASVYILEKYLRLEGGNLGNALNRYVGHSKTGYREKVVEALGEIHMAKYEGPVL